MIIQTSIALSFGTALCQNSNNQLLSVAEQQKSLELDTKENLQQQLGSRIKTPDKQEAPAQKLAEIQTESVQNPTSKTQAQSTTVRLTEPTVHETSEPLPATQTQPLQQFSQQPLNLPEHVKKQDKQERKDIKSLERLSYSAENIKPYIHVPAPDDSNELIEFQFENTDLKNLLQQVGDLYDVTFIPDDIINPINQAGGGVATAGNKISFRTHKGMTKKQAWDVFLKLLYISGFTVVPDTDRRYRVVSIAKGLRSPVPAYIGTDYQKLPNNDQIIHYVYFVENGNIAVIQSIVNKLRSSASDLLVLNDAKAFILTDKSYNIKSLMEIVKELDRVSMPQALSVIQLFRADAKDIQNLLNELMGTSEKQPPMFMQPRQQPTALFFPQNTRIIAEPRTNTLIVLGTPEAIEKIKEFVKTVDKDREAPHSPLYYYDLKYADAETVLNILNETAGKFGKEPPTEAGRVGGVRGIDKYLKPMSFIADKSTNRIIMRGDYQDYLMIKDLIAKIDLPQPQVAIEVLVLTVSLQKLKKLGSQIRNCIKPCGGTGLNNHLQFQTSGLNGNGGIIERDKTTADAITVPDRLMGNLLNLVKGLEIGNTIISLGQDIFGVWGLIQLFESLTVAETVANPFILASNKQKAKVEVGEIRRVITSEIVQTADQRTPTFDDNKATLNVEITPQINSDGMIALDIKISIVNFLPGSTAENVAKLQREIDTKAIVSDREVLALGGLIRNNMTAALSKTPGLGDVPLLGWLFKNKSKSIEDDNLLVLISVQVIDPLFPTAAKRFTQHHVDDYYGTLDAMHDISENRDPIYRMFFKDQEKSVDKRVEGFIFEKPVKRTAKAKKRERLKAKKEEAQRLLANSNEHELVGKQSKSEQENQSNQTAPMQVASATKPKISSKNKISITEDLPESKESIVA